MSTLITCQTCRRDLFVAADLALDIDSNTATYEGGSVKLTNMRFDTLQVLSDCFPEPISNEDLYFRVKGYRDSTIDEYDPTVMANLVCVLRKQLEPIGLGVNGGKGQSYLLNYRLLSADLADDEHSCPNCHAGLSIDSQMHVDAVGGFILFGGKWVLVKPQSASICRVLLQNHPNRVSKNRIFRGIHTGMAGCETQTRSYVSTIVSQARKALSPLGVEIDCYKREGYALRFPDRDAAKPSHKISDFSRAALPGNGETTTANGSPPTTRRGQSQGKARKEATGRPQPAPANSFHSLAV